MPTTGKPVLAILVGALLILRTDPVWALGSAVALTLVVASTAVALARGTTGAFGFDVRLSRA